MSFYDGSRRESCAHFYPQETFPILPNRPFDEIPKADTIQLGRGLERGHRSELAVMPCFHDRK
jgi:hypothetical protein